MPFLVRYALIGAGVFALQWLVLGRLTLWGSYPDAVLLFVAWVGLREGRRVGSLAGFGLGALMDIAYGTWGIYMFAKTLVGFLLGLFPADQRESLRLQPRQGFLGGLVVALLHNGIVVIFLALQTDASNSFMVFGLWLGAALYTAFVSVVATLFSAS
ncbi:MAG: rod shape-determining protein MreD [Bacteroidetes bacterium]|jgi:rod shape-determining protein MreD|nr:rod shape-determining protein MreD [Bacteroidota bacterium]